MEETTRQECRKIIYQGGQGEYIEKKSRFIADIRPVESEEAAAKILEEIRKNYWDARHHCYAYIIGDQAELVRCSDDKEPSGTAGMPILNVLKGQNLHNVIAVVSRYFGGTLLGTGGLVRAYTGAVKAGLAQCTMMEKLHCYKVHMVINYALYGKAQYIAESMKILCADSEFLDNVHLCWLCRDDEKDVFIEKIMEVSAASALITEIEECYAGISEEAVIYFQ